jgi:hypothetical protein
VKHRFKSIEGAVRRIRQLEKQQRIATGILTGRNLEIKQLDSDRKLMARLAADGPCFFNPLEAMAAKQRRNLLLAAQWLNPDGSPVPKGGVS